MNRRSGFTLIELLVVIAIIAILAAILFPVFVTARSKAQQTKCLNNLKQVGLAVTQYCDDWNGTYPVLYIDQGLDPVNNVTYGVFRLLKPYLNNYRILRCPSYRNSKIISYGYNSYYADNLFGYPRRNVPANLSRILAPRCVVAIFDIARDAINEQFPWGGAYPGFNYYVFNPPYHNGGMNFAFADGHAQWYNTSTLPGIGNLNSYPYTWRAMKISFKISFNPAVKWTW